jgi:hypothetical protein
MVQPELAHLVSTADRPAMTWCRLSVALAVALAVATSACSSPVDADARDRGIMLLSQPADTALLIGTVIAEPLTVAVLENGQAVAGVEVRFTVDNSGITAIPAVSTTDDRGRASVKVVLGAHAGPQTITVSATGAHPKNATWSTFTGRLTAVAGHQSGLCGMTQQGTIHCWSPATPGLIAEVDAGRTFATLNFDGVAWCAVGTDGRVHCWTRGLRSFNGTPIVSSEVVGSYPVFRKLSGANSWNDASWCGLPDDGAIWCWGNNRLGLLGDGTSTHRMEPHPLAVEQHFVDLALAYTHGCGLTREWVTWCWGSNQSGQLGHPPDGSLHVPRSVPGAPALSAITAIGNDPAVVCGLASGGEAWCWGEDRWGGLGRRPGQLHHWVPARVETAVRFHELRGNGLGTMGLDRDGVVWHWGQIPHDLGVTYPTSSGNFGLGWTGFLPGDTYDVACGNSSSGTVCLNINTLQHDASYPFGQRPYAVLGIPIR